MRKSRIKYIALIALAVFITPTLVQMAYDMRNGFYIGGEWFVIVLFPLLGLLWDSCKEMIEEVKR